jgi:hypothetical protein
VNAASYTSGIGKLYDDLATEAKAFTAKAHEQVAALKKTEADIEAKLEATTKDLADAKAHETRASRTWFGFGESKAVKAIEEKQGLLEEELATARKETQRHVSSIIDQLWEMQKWNIVAIKAKYKDVAGLVSAAK